jgi:hypothetical protein
MTTLGSSSAPHPSTVSCIICLQKVAIEEVTAGSLYADGHQAFACSIHFAERARWIIAWAVFDYHQRQLQEIASLAESQI